MWTRIVLILTLFFLFGCSTSSEKKSFEESNLKLKLKFDFKSKGVLKLFELINETPRLIDSIELNNQSEVEFVNKIEGPGFYIIQFTKESSYTFVLDSIPLELNIKGSLNMPLVKAETNSLNDYFQKIKIMQIAYDRYIDSLNQRYILAENFKDKNQLESINRRYSEIENITLLKLKKSIYENQPSIVSVFVANLIGYEKEPSLNDSLAVKLKDQKDNSVYIKSYIENVERLQKAMIGNMAPNFTLNSIDGKKISVSDYKGKVLLIDFWASWCGPCRKSNPKLVKLYDKFKDNGFDILGVSLDEDLTKWKEAVKADKLVWSQVSDLKGWDNIAAKMYNVEEIPQTFLIDKSGKIIARKLTGDELELKIRELLK